MEGLGAHGDARDAAGGERVEQGRGDALGVALDGELGGAGGDVREVVGVVERVEEDAPEVDAQERGGSAADEDGGERRAGGGGAPCPQLADEPVGEGLLAVAGVDDGVEVAVVALMGAEWDVKIERPDGPGASPRVREGPDFGRGQASGPLLEDGD